MPMMFVMLIMCIIQIMNCLQLSLLMLLSRFIPGDFSLDNAKFSFVDAYKLSRSVEPALVYMDGSATLANGVLKLAMIPNEGISEGTVVATSLDVTMYGQYTSASDYLQ